MLVLASTALISACTTNSATGEKQFTALMPASSEAQVGATEHAKVEAQFGKFMTGPISDYVNKVGQRVAANTERKDVQYKFYVLDTPMVNAFALPGGYTYFSRGLLTLANSEAELAGVIGHEIGHITGRHAASRMSQGFVVGLGAAVIGAAVGGSAGDVANLGSNLYISSYSRGQESQSDELGIRYLSRAGYNSMAMATFLSSLDAQSKLENGGKSNFSYFSSHPLTAQRIQEARVEAAKYPANNNEGRAAYLNQINGLVYGDSPEQGFAKGNRFYHPEMDFTFSVPQGSKITNAPQNVVAQHPNGTVIVFDAGKGKSSDPLTFLRNEWLKGENGGNAEAITVNGKRAATTAFSGNVKGKAMTIRLVAVEWSPNTYYRFQMAIPNGVSNAFMNELKTTTYSLRAMTASEKTSVKPKKIRVLVAPAGASVASMAAKMNVEGDKEAHFRVLNGMGTNTQLLANQPYKIVM